MEGEKKPVQKRNSRSRKPGWNLTNLQKKQRIAKEKRMAETGEEDGI